jgi:signal transduction histidine kinase
MRTKPHTSTLSILFIILLAGISATAGLPTDLLNKQTLSALEAQLTDIQAELDTLANYSIRSGTGAVGYRSIYHDTTTKKEWIQIDFQTAHSLDEVILVPVVRRDPLTGFSSDGFPRHLRLIAGTVDNPDGQLVAEYTEPPNEPTRIAPLLMSCPGVTASWIRIETDQLALRSFDDRYVLQLSEIMAFSGPENVALHQSVTTKSSWGHSRAWSAAFLIDGFVPYLMDAARGEQSASFMTKINNDNLLSLTIDLENTQPVSGLTLHAIDTSYVLPQAHSSDYGIPQGMRLEGANQPDFSDSQTLLELKLESIYKMASVMYWAFPASTCRYVRLTQTAPSGEVRNDPNTSIFGFTEIELLFNGTNVALGKTITANKTLSHQNRPLKRLTDGRNMFGNILPLRDWMEQLARRHELEATRPLVEAELARRYARQKENLQSLIWLTALLAAGIGCSVLIGQLIKQRHIAKIKERFAADLHDELGANLHTIGLLSDLAEEAKDEPDELTMLHQRIRSVTERTGTAMRHCTNMVEANELYAGLEKDMRRAAERIMAKLDHNLSIEGTNHLNQLKPSTRADLFLFYKETLVNISRHSGATCFSTRLTADKHEVRLHIRDNGCGLSEGIPASLKRRARLLGAHVTVDTPADGGTDIYLQLKTRRWGRRK